MDINSIIRGGLAADFVDRTIEVLQRDGLREVTDLLYVTVEDLVEMELPKLQARRLYAHIQRVLGILT